MDPSLVTDHSRQSVHVYIKEDIKDAQHISFDLFTRCLLGLSPQRLEKWVSIISQEKWHEDRELAEGLEQYCYASSEAARYDPFCAIMNRALQMAHGRLPDVPDTYPIDDLCAKRSDPLAIRPIAEHGALGATRKPDAVIFRARHADKLKSTSSKPPVAPVQNARQSSATSKTRAKAQKKLAGSSTTTQPRRTSS